MNSQVKDKKKDTFIYISDKYYGVLSAILTVCSLLLAVLYGGMLGGENVFISADLYEQCAPFTVLYARKWIEGSNLYYSFNTGLGMNTSLIFSFGILSPFNVLYFFANGNNVNDIALAVFVLKAGMAAFCFQLFSKYNLKVNGVISVLFSMGYALASYGIAIVYSPSLYDGIYLFPLILVAIKYLVDENKIIWLTLLYTLLFVTNFYSGYIVGISSFAYLCVYIILVKKTDKKISILKRYFIGVFCSFLLSAFVLAPTVYDVLKQNAFDTEYTFTVVPVWNMVSSIFPFMDFKMSAKIPYIYCGIPAIILMVAFFTNVNIEKKYKIVGCSAILLGVISMVFQPFYSLAHMFNDPTGYTYRYAYIISLILCSMGLIAFKNRDGIRLKKTILIVGGLVFIHSLSPIMNKTFGLYDNSPSFFGYLITVLGVIIWGCIFYIFLKSEKKDDDTKKVTKRNIAIISLIIMSFEVGINSYIMITTQYQNTEENYRYVSAQADLLTREIKGLDDSEYRVHYDGLMNMNQACAYDYKGATLYATSNNQALKNFLYSMGISCSDFFILGKGSTDLTKLLLNEKYDLGAYLNYNEWNENYIEENPTVGFGFMVDAGINDIDYSDNVFDNQNAVYSALLGKNVTPYIEYTGDVLFEGENVVASTTDAGDIHFSLEENESIGYLKITLSDDSGKDMYTWLSSGHNRVHSMSPVIYSPSANEECEYIKSLLMAPHIVKMSEEDSVYDIFIYLASNTVNEAVIKECHFVDYDDSYIYELWEKLSHQVLYINTFEDGYIVGNIDVQEPGICYVSIPFEEGWHVCVDGASADIVSVFNGAFIGIPLDCGYHDIELRFEAPYSRLGIALSCIGILLLCGILLFDFKQYRNKR